MSIQTLNYGRISEYRIGKMLTAENQEQATKLRGWHSFLKAVGLNKNGVRAREQKLLDLYEELHSEASNNTNSEQSKPSLNVSKLIIFVKIRALIDSPAVKQQFRACIQSSSAGQPAYLGFLIGKESIYSVKFDNTVNQVFLNKFTNSNGNIQDEIVLEADTKLSKNRTKIELTATGIEQLYKKQQLALMLQEAIRGFSLPNLRNKQGYNRINNSAGRTVAYIEYNHKIPQEQILKLYQFMLEKALDEASKNQSVSKKTQEHIENLCQLELNLALKMASEKASKGQPVSKDTLERIQKLRQFSVQEALKEKLEKAFKAQPKGQAISSQEGEQELDEIKKGDEGRRIANLILPFPPQLKRTDSDQRGAYKQLTHANKDYVGLTQIEGTPCILSRKLREDLKDLKFIVPQYYVRDNFYIAKNLNQCLMGYARRNLSLTLKQFRGILLDLKQLHERNIAHRDIKPENLFLSSENDEVYLSDLDSMGYIGEFTGPFGTSYYSRKGLVREPNFYGKLIDNVCLLTSIIMLTLGIEDKAEPNELIKWISYHIKPKYRKQAELMMFKPFKYYKLYMEPLIIRGEGRNVVELVDMIQFNSSFKKATGKPAI